MALSLREYYAFWAADLLQKDLLPIAIETAGLPAHTRLADLQALNLFRPEPDIVRDVCGSKAAFNCSECLLFAAVLHAEALCRTPLDKNIADLDEASSIAACIQGLIWRDALAYAEIIELESALDQCLEGSDEAEAQWQKWLMTEAAVKDAQAAFLKNCANDLFY
ncbi:MAG: hypothetical protein CVV27_01440 [Candidatus Melainabacteria bacterium HGW-Melainabacteria-1]|nr:MAG: hypothetical protein CVV27_01440 [Candidatus Melainabacteria bacterium HGW-Melainabacteria-1]